MIKLTEFETKMLNGEMGRLKQKALEKIVQYAKALGAKELCKVTKATLGLGAQPYLNHIKSDDYNKVFSKVYMGTDEVLDIKNEKFSNSCFCLTCTENCDADEYKDLGLKKEFFDKNKAFLEITKHAGVNIASTCTPYFIGWLPLKGEHFVTTESSNAMFCNSILGACGNPDGVEAAIWSAICGRTPKWGFHVSKSRYATHEFKVECSPKTAKDWDVIGYTIGRLLPSNGLPVITGEFENPSTVEIKQLFASIATTSGAVMCHIVGMTPEAHTLKMATGNTPVKGRFVISQKEYDESMMLLCNETSAVIDFVSLGCPHYSLEEIQKLADYIKGKTIKDGVKLYIWTAYPIKEMAKINGYLDVIHGSGARILTNSCPIMVGETIINKSTGIALDGAKQAHYIRSMTDANVYYGDMKQCVNSAISGKWVLE